MKENYPVDQGLVQDARDTDQTQMERILSTLERELLEMESSIYRVNQVCGRLYAIPRPGEVSEPKGIDPHDIISAFDFRLSVLRKGNDELRSIACLLEKVG